MSTSTLALPPVKLLSIDGGGVRGLSALVILEQILDQANALRKEQGLEAQEPWQVFDMIGGTSTGGLIAIMLGRLRMSITATIDAYMKLSSEAFSPKNLMSQSAAKVTLKSKFKTEPLEKALREVIGQDWSEKLLRDDNGFDTGCRVFVVTHQTGVSNTVEILRSYRNLRKARATLDTMKIWEAARATSAALTFFEPIKIQGVEYRDGGLMYNNPVALVHAEASEVFGNREQTIISLGTGRVSTRRFAPSLLTIAKDLAEIATNTERQADDFYRRDDSKAAKEGRYFRFNVPEIGDSGLAEATNDDLNYLVKMTEGYLDKPEISNKLLSCSERLAEGTLTNPALEDNLTDGAMLSPNPLIRDDLERRMQMLLPMNTVDKGEPTLSLKPFLYHTDIRGDHRNEVLQWVSNLDFRQIHEQYVTEREEGTGDIAAWIPTEFASWLEGHTSLVWIKGIPGAGKSTVISSLIESIDLGHRNNIGFAGTAVAYIYLQKDLSGLKYVDILACILRQIAETREDLSQIVTDAYQRYQFTHIRPRAAEYQAMLQNEARKFKTVYIFIDALDRGNGDLVSNLLYELTSLRRSASNTRILVSSLEASDYRHVLAKEGADEVRIVAKDEEIGLYVDQRIGRSAASDMSKFCARDTMLKSRISSIVRQKAQGMFLMAKLLMEILVDAKCFTRNQFLALLNNLPNALDATYEQLWTRISMQEEHRAALAKRIFTWVTYGQESLTFAALRHALHSEESPDSFPFSADDLVNEDILAVVCLGVISIKPKTETVDFVHYTAEEFFPRFFQTRYQDETFSPHRTIALACMKYIKLTATVDCCTAQQSMTSFPSPATLKDDHFGRYAGLYWGTHVALASPTSILEEVLAFIRFDACVRRAAVILINNLPKIWHGQSPSPRPCAEDTTAIHLAAYFGLRKVLEALFQKICDEASINEAGNGSWTPLRWAILNHQTEIVDFLIDRGADLDLIDEQGETSLMWSIGRKADGLNVKNLNIWDCSVQIGGAHTLDFEDWLADTCINRSNSTTTMRTSREILEMLVRKTPSFDGQDRNGRTALSLAAEIQDGELVRELLKRGADGGLLDKDDMTPLLWALQPPNRRVYDQINIWGSARVHLGLHLLVEANDLSISPEGSHNILRQHSERSESLILDIITAMSHYDQSKRMDAWEKQDLFGCTALSLAAHLGYGQVVNRLLSHGARVDVVDNEGRTALIRSLLSPAAYSYWFKSVNFYGDARVHIGDLIDFTCDFQTYMKRCNRNARIASRRLMILDLIAQTREIGQIAYQDDDATGTTRSVSAYDIAIEQGFYDIAQAIKDRAQQLGCSLHRDDSAVAIEPSTTTWYDQTSIHVGNHYLYHGSVDEEDKRVGSLINLELRMDDSNIYGRSRIQIGNTLRYERRPRGSKGTQEDVIHPTLHGGDVQWLRERPLQVVSDPITQETNISSLDS